MRALAAVAVVSALTMVARADATPPWAVGVTDAQKATAQRALDAGNALFLERKYGEALTQYTAAVAAWDHPAIRFNMVRCLIQLEKPVEASDNLKLALAYGAAPLEAGVYTEALTYEKLLANEIGEVAVTCTQRGASVTLDGQPLAPCPATQTLRVKPGSHGIVGQREGFLTASTRVVVVGGAHEAVSVTLVPLAKAAHIEHRWPTWVPWVVFGSGFGVAGVGVALELSAVATMNGYDETVAHDCTGKRACLPADTPLRQKSLAERESRVGAGFLVGGAVVVATGAAMLYLNRGRSVLPRSIERMTPAVAPMSGGGAALVWRGSF